MVSLMTTQNENFSARRHKLFWNLPYQKKLMTVLAVTALILTVFMACVFLFVATDSISDIGTRLSEDRAAYACSLVEKYFDQVSANSAQFLRLHSLRSILKPSSEAEISLEDRASLAADIQEIVTYSHAVSQIDYTMINIYCENGFRYTSSAAVRLPFDDFQGCIDYYTAAGYLDVGYNGSTWCHLVETPRQDQRQEFSFLYFRPLYSASSYKVVGVLLAAISEESINRLYADYSPDAYIVHESGIVVSATDKAFLNQPIADPAQYEAIRASKEPAGTLLYDREGGPYMVSYRKIAYNDAYVVIPFQYYHGWDKSELRQIALWTILIACAGLLFAFSMSSFFSRSLSRSIQEITSLSRQVEAGNRQARYQARQNDEISYIGNSINAMLDQIEADNLRQQRQEQLQQALELQLLQSQINPHLLYNSLNSAMWSLQSHDAQRAQDILCAMSRFFKRSLSSGCDIIPLHAEVDLLQSYLDVQNLTRGKQFCLSVELDEALENLSIPKFTLQPAVENAVLHGFTSFRDDGKISLTGSRHGPLVVLDVLDNGIGIEPAELSILNDRLRAGDMPTDGSAFGLYNVNLRIQNMFGPQSRMWLESEVGEYTRVHFALHLNAEEESHV